MSNTLKAVNLNLMLGTPTQNVLRLAGNVADGETITVDGEVYEIDIINTDSTLNLAANMNATDAETELAMAAHGRKVNDLIRIDNEIMQVNRVLDVNTIRVSRGRAGTTRATHTAGADIFQSDAAPATNYPIGLVTTLTPTVAAPAFVQTFNDKNSKGLIAEAISVNEILIRTRNANQPRNVACTETLATANNAWQAATSYGATAKGDVVAFGMQARAATAQEVALTFARFCFPFTVGAANVQIRTAAGALKTWDGQITFTGQRVTVDNNGATDWAAGDILTVIATE